MRVLVDARNITDEPNGVGRYARALIPRLITARPRWDWTILRHASNREPLFEAREIFSEQPIDGLANVVRGHREYARATDGRAPDVLHSLFHMLPRGARAARIVVTAHDFIWIDHPEISQASRLGAISIAQFARVAIPAALRAANRVIAVSDATAARAAAYVEPNRISVIPHGVDPIYFEPPPPADPIIEFLRRDGGRTIVAVGNDKQYKNLGTLVRAFAALDEANVRLVLVGRADGLLELAAALGCRDRVVPAGWLADTDLRRVVANADVFVFPSLVEGFGLPPLEAMALGVPTIVSDLEPMRGIAGDAALRFEPTDVFALTTLLRAVLQDPRLAERLAAMGRARAAQFDWDVTARRTVALYEGP